MMVIWNESNVVSWINSTADESWDPMDDILNNIDSDKRDRIINAAIDEFAAYPFEKASTNNIVKKAGIL